MDDTKPGGKLRLTKFNSSPTLVGETIGRQRVDQDVFAPYYDAWNLVTPPFRFDRLYTIKEESDILQACITTYRKNIDGFGYDTNFLGDDFTERTSKEAETQLTKLNGFFDQVNEEGPFSLVRDQFRDDYETFGNGAMEVLRFPRSSRIAAIYYMPVIDMRMSKLDDEPIAVTVPLFREGQVRNVKIKKRFRKYAQMYLGDSRIVKWFKEFGDPRILDAVSGEYVSSAKEATEIATEIFWVGRNSSGRAYGIPRWIGSVTDVIGRSMAQYVNYDLFDSQGISPMMIIVENGTLTDESREELQNIVTSMRGVENFNKISLLEAIPELRGLDDKSNVRVNLKSMAEYRKEDVIFESYLNYTEKVIRQAFRLPSLYLGGNDNLSYASSYSSQKLCEQQVFMPERLSFDSLINNYIVWPELKCNLWQYTSRGPQLVSSEELRLALKEFVSAGALTANNAIDIANEMFGLEMSKYDADWANLPIALVKTMNNNGSFVLDAIFNNDPKASKAPIGNTGGRPSGLNDTQPPMPFPTGATPK